MAKKQPELPFEEPPNTELKDRARALLAEIHGIPRPGAKLDDWIIRAQTLIVFEMARQLGDDSESAAGTRG